MSIKYESIVKTDTISLTKCPEGRGDNGYWLYDKTVGINLAMRAKTEQEAFTKAIEFHQNRYKKIEKEYADLKNKVENFVGLFVEDGNFEVE